MSFGFDNYDISKLVGRTITAITGDGSDLIAGVRDEAAVDVLLLTLDDGTRVRMHHEQDCCETAWLAEVVGDFADIIGSPLLMAEESTSAERPADAPTPEYEPMSQTWTFYRFATAKGYVTLRWCATSNGYYSERITVDVERDEN